jgi:hypothetical protein
MDLKSSSYTKVLTEAIKTSEWKDTVIDYSKGMLQRPKISSKVNTVTYIPLEHQLFHMEEFQEFIFYFFSCETHSKGHKP